MELVGSQTSPYVRRIRLFLHGQDFSFKDLNIYSEAGRKVLETYTPAMKIPVLVDGDQRILDSRVIQRYLANKAGHPAFSPEQENLLTIIDALNDAYITLLIASRSGIDIQSDSLIIQLQKERITRTLALLETEAEQGTFTAWDYPSICLFCLLDWAVFRELCSLDNYPALQTAYDAHKERPGVSESDPRLPA